MQDSLSIVVGVAEDPRIKLCLESIDFPAEVIVVLNGSTSHVRSIVSRFAVRVLELRKSNIGKAYDIGVHAACNDKVVLMDADCTFEPGALSALCCALNHADVCRGTVLFTADSLQSRVTSRARTWHTTDILNAFKPPLGIRRSALVQVGGHCFDHEIRWREDYELTCRLRAAGIAISYVPAARVRHPPLSFLQDLAAGFRYGRGHRNGVRRGLLPSSLRWGGHRSLAQSLRVDLQRARHVPVQCLEISRRKGVLTTAYLICWMAAFSLGYYTDDFLRALERSAP